MTLPLYALEHADNVYRAAHYQQTAENTYTPQWHDLPYLEWIALYLRHGQYRTHTAGGERDSIYFYDLNKQMEKVQ